MCLRIIWITSFLIISIPDTCWIQKNYSNLYCSSSSVQLLSYYWWQFSVLSLWVANFIVSFLNLNLLDWLFNFSLIHEMGRLQYYFYGGIYVVQIFIICFIGTLVEIAVSIRSTSDWYQHTIYSGYFFPLP